MRKRFRFIVLAVMIPLLIVTGLLFARLHNDSQINAKAISLSGFQYVGFEYGRNFPGSAPEIYDYVGNGTVNELHAEVNRDLAAYGYTEKNNVGMAISTIIQPTNIPMYMAASLQQ